MLEVVGSHFYIKNVFMSCLNYLWLAKILLIEQTVEHNFWKFRGESHLEVFKNLTPNHWVFGLNLENRWIIEWFHPVGLYFGRFGEGTTFKLSTLMHFWT